jgi:hypothetical protein
MLSELWSSARDTLAIETNRAAGDKDSHTFFQIERGINSLIDLQLGRFR